MSDAAKTPDRPLISVVTVVLNAKAALSRTMQSVGCQEYDSYEHIIKDGGSVDGGVETAAEGRNSRVVVKRDSGVYDGMNQAIDECRGDYILFMNSGDRLHGPDALRKIADGLARGAWPDIAYCDLIHGESGALIAYPSHISKFFLYRTTLCHQSCVVRRDCYARFGRFDTSLRIGADHDFLTRALLEFGATYRHVPHACVEYEGGGLSRAARNRNLHAQEVATVRRRRFTLARRTGYAVLLALSLPPLRRAVHDRPSLRWLRRPYLRLLNLFYAMTKKPWRGGRE